jgi:hypothetical protein
MRELSVYQGHLLLAYAACPENTTSEDELASILSREFPDEGERMRLVRAAGQSLVEAGAPLSSEAES